MLPADTVILAVGQAPDLDLLGALELERAPQGTVRVDPATLRTSHPKMWAGGDVAKGPRNLIDAIADGKRAAASIHAALTNAPEAPSEPADRFDIELVERPGFRRIASGYDAIDRVAVPVVPTDRRVGFTEVEEGFDETGATLEALRCLRCFDNVMLDPALCILCGLCVDVCPTDCITIVRADRIGSGRGHAVGAAPRRRPLHSLRVVRQSLPAGRAVDGRGTGGRPWLRRHATRWSPSRPRPAAA